jgi:polysaccharide export outer membrane protein
MLLAACADGSDTPLLELAPSDGSKPELARIYRLGVGDRLKVSVYGEPELSGTFEVSGTGVVALPLVGDVVAKGRPIVDFRKAVAARLKQGYLKNPHVTVEVVNYRPIYVHGEVRTGGEYAYRNGLKIRDAIAVAGGYSSRASLGYVLITREGRVDEARVSLPSDLDVMPGDNIRVPERWF